MPHSYLVLAAALAAATVACSPKADSAPAKAEAPVESQPAEAQKEPAKEKPAKAALEVQKGTTLYGEKLSEGDAISIGSVLNSVDSHTGKTLLVTGHVRKICQKKGCWLEMAEAADESLQGCRVMFKDYGFFVPMGAGGATAKLEGTIELHTLAKETVTHLEGDGGVVHNKKADGTAQEVRFIASGVELTL